MYRTLARLTIILVTLTLTGCSLVGKVARIIGNAGSDPWIKISQCVAHDWSGEGAIACPVSRKGSEVTNMLVIPNRRPQQQESMNQTPSGGQVGMRFVIYRNHDDAAELENIVSAITNNINTDDYLVPEVLNGRRN